MSIFKKVIMDKLDGEKTLCKKIKAFSNTLMSAMSLSEKDVEEAEKLRITWETENYVIYPQSRPWNGWNAILEVIPKNVFESSNGHGLGWSNLSHDPLPEGWTYISRGTATKIFPPKHERDIVVNELLALTQDGDGIAN